MNETRKEYPHNNVDFISSRVTDPDELNELVNYSAEFEDLKFGFSDQYLSKLKEMINEPHAFQEILRSEAGDFAGYVAASESIFPNYTFLAELFVNPIYAGKGLGTKLVQDTIEAARANGLAGVMTQTEHENLPAQKLYEKMGFEQIENPNSSHITYQLKFDHES